MEAAETKIRPSSAYCTRPSSPQATVVSRPLSDSTGLSPVFISSEAPVP